MHVAFVNKWWKERTTKNFISNESSRNVFNRFRIFTFVNHIACIIVSLIEKVAMKSRNLTKSLLIINDVKEKQQRLEIRLDLRSLAMKVWEKFLIDLEFLISYQDHIYALYHY